MNHFASPDFWICYNKLSPEIQLLANQKYELLKRNHHHPSLHLKKIRNYWSIRVGLNYRVLGIDIPDKDGIIWFWIGNHSEYGKLINQR